MMRNDPAYVFRLVIDENGSEERTLYERNEAGEYVERIRQKKGESQNTFIRRVLSIEKDVNKIRFEAVDQRADGWLEILGEEERGGE